MTPDKIIKEQAASTTDVPAPMRVGPAAVITMVALAVPLSIAVIWKVVEPHPEGTGDEREEKLNSGNFRLIESPAARSAFIMNLNVRVDGEPVRSLPSSSLLNVMAGSREVETGMATGAASMLFDESKIAVVREA